MLLDARSPAMPCAPVAWRTSPFRHRTSISGPEGQLLVGNPLRGSSGTPLDRARSSEVLRASVRPPLDRSCQAAVKPSSEIRRHCRPDRTPARCFRNLPSRTCPSRYGRPASLALRCLCAVIANEVNDRAATGRWVLPSVTDIVSQACRIRKVLWG